MEHKAWHYVVGRHARGTICGTGLEKISKAKEILAKQHRAKKEEVSIRAAGTKEWR